MKSATTKFLLFALLSVLLISCNTKKETDGPYFGNGFHNGWADQTSIVIWTRLTQNPEGNTDGAEFIDISREKENELDK